MKSKIGFLIGLGLMAAPAFGADLECSGRLRVPQSLVLDLENGTCLDGTAVLTTMAGEVNFVVKKIDEVPGLFSSTEYQLFAEGQPETKLTVTYSSVVSRGGGRGGDLPMKKISAKLVQPNNQIVFHDCYETNN